MESPVAAISEPLVKDHRHCDGLFASAEDAARRNDWAGCGTQFDAFNSAMLRHFEAEEDILFPAFEQATGMSGGPTAMMRSEHEAMRALLEGMQDAIAQSSGDDYLGLSETLLLYMQQHNLKEENVLYPMSERVLDASAIDFTGHLAANA